VLVWEYTINGSNKHRLHYNKNLKEEGLWNDLEHDGSSFWKTARGGKSDMSVIVEMIANQVW
jgi:hypothetical protein